MLPRPKKEAALRQAAPVTDFNLDTQPQEPARSSKASAKKKVLTRLGAGDGAPWCWQRKNARRLIRTASDGASITAFALGVYDALTEIASDEQKPLFKTGQAHIAEFAGCSVPQVKKCLALLVRLDLLKIETEGLKSWNTYRLLEVIRDSSNKASDSYNRANISSIVADVSYKSENGLVSTVEESSEQSAEESSEEGGKKVTTTTREPSARRGSGASLSLEKETTSPAARDSGGPGDDNHVEQGKTFLPEHGAQAPKPPVASTPFPPAGTQEMSEETFVKGFVALWNRTSDSNVELTLSEIRRVKTLMRKTHADWEEIGRKGLLFRFAFGRYAWKLIGKETVEDNGEYDPAIFPSKFTQDVGLFFAQLGKVMRWYGGHVQGAGRAGFDAIGTQKIVKAISEACDDPEILSTFIADNAEAFREENPELGSTKRNERGRLIRFVGFIDGAPPGRGQQQWEIVPEEPTSSESPDEKVPAEFWVGMNEERTYLFDYPKADSNEHRLDHLRIAEAESCEVSARELKKVRDLLARKLGE